MNEELKKELAALLEDFKGKVPTNEQIKSLSDKIAQLENSKNDEEVKALRDEIEQLKKAAREQGEKMVILEKGKSAENRKSIDDLFKSDKGKELLAGVKGKTGQAEFEVKDAANITTANVGGDTGPLLSLLGVAGDVYYIRPAIGDSILNAVTVENTDKAAITWVDEVAGEGAVATVAEGGQKPLLDIKFEEKTSNAIKKAGMVKVTEEAIDDISYMSGVINRALNEKLRDAIETDVINGVIGIATTYNLTDYNGKVEKASMIDAINAAIAQSVQSPFVPTAIAMNPVDVIALRFIKSTDGTPVVSYFNEGKLPMLNNGLRIIMNDGITKGDFVLGDFTKYRVAFYKRKLVMGWDGTDFSHNLRSIIAEARYHKYASSNEIGTFVKGTFATIIAAINKPEATE